MARRIGKAVLWLVLIALAAFAVLIASDWDRVQRLFLGGVKVYETTPPALPGDLQRPAILVFSKTNGFRHEEAIPAANALLAGFARENGWGYFQTENGATFDPAILARFDAVVFNNVTGDVFTAAQRQAMQDFITGGGGFVGIHAAGDNSHKGWPWYVKSVIGTTFIGHPMKPQFQKATMQIEDRTHPATRVLPSEIERVDEWYSFDKSPRGAVHVLATLDERSYNPVGMYGQELRMGRDHPIVWWSCVGKGPVLYSAPGHTAASYGEPAYRTLLLGALRWSLGLEGEACGRVPAKRGEPR